ncbi:MAG: cardiolipin synthase [Myxococcales bacterium]|nr:cardiolipin synthase [Myxococcales bacterium]
MSWTLILTLLELVWIIVAGIVVVLQRRSATSTLAWLFALAFLPVVGFVIYWVIGPQRLTRKKLARRVSRQVVRAAMAGLAEARTSAPEHARLSLVPLGLGEAPPLPAVHITPYFDGDSTYRAICAAIEAATHHVHLEYYIWEPDVIGTRLRDLLIAKAKAGVEVRMLVDATGSAGLRRGWRRPLYQAGVQFAWFNPITFKLWRRRRADFRSHRKIVVCDGVVGFTGGMNVADAHAAEFGPNYWRDTHLRFDGPAVASLQRAFLQDWYYASGTLPSQAVAYFPEVSVPDDEHGDAVQVVASGPDEPGYAVHKTYFAAITSARSRLWITTPYFIPDDAIMTALAVAALGRVDVRVLVPKKGDSRVVDLAARSYFAELLAAGVKIFEYEPRFIHAKTMVIDDDLAIVATANLDNRSFRLNFELAAVVYGQHLVGQLAAAFVEDLRSARAIVADELARQRFRTRLGQASARLLSPLL